MRDWDTSCPDWKARFLAGQSLVPELPLFRDQAEKALRIFKRLRVPDLIGRPTMGEVAGPWLFPIVEAIFGSYDPVAHRRMIQEFFWLIPKKNGKTSTAAAIMVEALILNERPEGEFVLVAPTKEVADIAFRQATGTIRADPELDKLFHPQQHIRKITHRRTGASLQVKAADTDVITGGKQVGTLVDELHVLGGKANANEVMLELRGALTARPDGFLIFITTQSKKPPAGVMKSELQRARDVRDGKLQLPLLPILYEMPPEVTVEGGWKRRKYWPLVNPNLGRSVDEEFLVQQLQAKEAEGADALALFASQHFNVEIGVGLSSDGWAGAQFWHRGNGGPATLEELIERCDVATVGLDGGGLDDLFGFGVIGRERVTRRWLVWAHALISPEGQERRKANATVYADFIEAGDLTVVEELADDLTWICDRVEMIRDAGILAMVGADPAGIGGAVDALAEIGVTEDAKLLTGVPQGIRLMNAAKTIERKLVDGTLKHSGSGLLAWCAGNAKVRQTSTATMIERAASGFGKIDPLMAVFNAAHLMGFNPEASMIDQGFVAL